MNDVLSSGTDAPAQRLSRDFLHELRTPLNQIIGYSEMLAEQAQDEGHTSIIADLLRIQAAASQLATLLNDTSTNRYATPLSGALQTSTAPARTPEQRPAQTPEAQHGLLLVVDDNEMNRDMLSRRLERQGYQVATATDGRETMAAVRARPFDLVLLDIMMPEIDGYEVLQQLKADDTLRHIPVIMISAIDELDSVVRCIELGAEDYLPKPFNPTLLKARIGAALERKRSRDREMKLFDQLEQKHKRLQELEKLRDDLMNMIVHDLRTPLSSLLGGVQMLDKLGELNEQQLEMAGIAIRGGNRLLSMINDLLDVEKMESGSMQLDYGMVQAADLVTGAVAQVSWLIENKKLELVTDIAAEIPPFKGDQEKLQRVLVNLLANAIKFTPTGGTITVHGAHSADGQFTEFSVRDTGEGIPAEDFEHIFEKFGQVESRQAGRTMSTGLGLTFCKLAVEAHGGDIRVQSERGAGSTFTFTIPFKK